jgi:hypothetical protein
MKQIFKFLFCILLIAGSSLAKGSNPSLIKSMDTTKTTLNHNIKWNVGLIARGVFMFDYEVRLSKKLSALIGCGVTSRDLIFEISRDINIGSGFGRTNAKGGFAAAAGFRFYPVSHTNFKGLFFQPTASYREYRLTDKTVYNYNYYTGNNTSLKYSPSYKLYDVELQLGYQFGGSATSIHVEVYSGFGYRTAKYKGTEYYDEYVTVYNNDPYYPQYYQQIVNTQRVIKITDTNMRPVLGVKLCYPF